LTTVPVIISSPLYRRHRAHPYTIVIGYPWHSGDNQRWVFTWVGAAWTIRSVASGLYIGISTPTTEAATNGTLLVATEVPFNWHIWHDENDEESFRYNFFSLLSNVGMIFIFYCSTTY